MGILVGLVIFLSFFGFVCFAVLAIEGAEVLVDWITEFVELKRRIEKLERDVYREGGKLK